MQNRTNTTSPPTIAKPVLGVSASLQLSPISLNNEYRNEWNAHDRDFVCLVLNNELLRPTLYRVGGIGTPNVGIDRYFQILKHVEAFYSENILRMSNSNKPKHLESRWCIIDKFGNEKVELEQFKHLYLVKDSCIYSVDGNYYNIETGEFYCRSSSSMQSKNFLFLENSFDNDKSKRGVLKINKSDGTWSLFGL